MVLRTVRLPEDRPHLDRLTAEIERLDGYDPLSEDARLAMEAGGAGGGFVVDDEGVIVGFAHVRRSDDRVVIETAIHPAVRSRAAGMLVEASVAAADGEVVQLWATAEKTVAAAVDAGLAEVRRVMHLIRPLPPAEPARLPGAFGISRFRPHADVEGFLEVSNAAFAGHPDKGGWTAATVHSRTERSWFDPDGCFLAREQGRVVGVCWTKLHPHRVGEVYIIAVHPDAQGRSLATGLVLTGLWDLYERRGATSAMVYTDEDNARARGLYQRLGFEMLRVNRCFASPQVRNHR